MIYSMFHACLRSDLTSEDGVTGNGSNFTTTYKRPLSVPSAPNGAWSTALVIGSIPRTINNISAAYNNNKFYYSTDAGVTYKTIVIPNSYKQVEQLDLYIKAQIAENGDNAAGDQSAIALSYDGTTRRVDLWFNESVPDYRVKFEAGETLGTMLGFNPGVYSDVYQGDFAPDVDRGITMLYVLSNVVGTGTCTRGGIQSNVLAAINLSGPPGSIIFIEPNTPLWVTLGSSDQDVINEINIRIVDHRGREVDFDGFPVSLVLAFKKFYFGQNE